MGQFLGFVALEANLAVQALFRDANNSPANTDTPPIYRVYGPAGLMQNGTGTMTKQDQGTVSGASNASPITITSNGHGLTTGTRVTTSGILGNLAANTTTTVTVVDNNTFTLDGTTGSGGYAGGGIWNSSGVYTATVAAQAASGYVSGVTYSVLVEGPVAGTVKADTHTFTVV